MTRERLPSRRYSETLDIEVGRLRYTATLGFYPDGRLGEIFLTSSKAGSSVSIAASDSAVLCPIALQYQVPMETLRRALMRDTQGRAIGPLGAALDLVESIVRTVNPGEGGHAK